MATTDSAMQEPEFTNNFITAGKRLLVALTVMSVTGAVLLALQSTFPPRISSWPGNRHAQTNSADNRPGIIGLLLGSKEGHREQYECEPVHAETCRQG